LEKLERLAFALETKFGSSSPSSDFREELSFYGFFARGFLHFLSNLLIWYYSPVKLFLHNRDVLMPFLNCLREFGSSMIYNTCVYSSAK